MLIPVYISRGTVSKSLASVPCGLVTETEVYSTDYKVLGYIGEGQNYIRSVTAVLLAKVDRQI